MEGVADQTDKNVMFFNFNNTKRTTFRCHLLNKFTDFLGS